MARIGILIPTMDEARNAPARNAAYGFGPGKSAACAAAAKLVCDDKCDTILVWGTAGGIHARKGEAIVASHIAFSDYDIGGLFGSTGVGFVPDFTDSEGWHALDVDFQNILLQAFRKTYPEVAVRVGRLCSSDTFALPASPQDYNRIQATADAVDMESAAVAQFLKLYAPQTRLGVLRVVSNEPNGEDEFMEFLEFFARLNTRLEAFRALLEA